jgi:hypothetical protein
LWYLAKWKKEQTLQLAIYMENRLLQSGHKAGVVPSHDRLFEYWQTIGSK